MERYVHKMECDFFFSKSGSHKLTENVGYVFLVVSWGPSHGGLRSNSSARFFIVARHSGLSDPLWFVDFRATANNSNEGAPDKIPSGLS
jgi:hypothetical protein